MKDDITKLTYFIRDIFKTNDLIPLHAPLFGNEEIENLKQCIDSTFVSYAGPFVTAFEDEIKNFTKAKFVIPVTSGTAALHLVLWALNINENDEVITQGLSFIATANSISHTRANPIFLDVDKETLGLCPKGLLSFLEKNTIRKADGLYNKITKKRIKACVPVHIFGHICNIKDIIEICEHYNIDVIEDSAEAIGSFFESTHAGLFGKVGILSFNGNKIITTGGGGAIITNDSLLGPRLKHLSTTAKINHPYEYIHDEVGFNYRMPNINAAIGVAQLKRLPEYLKNKRDLAHQYNDFLNQLKSLHFFKEKFPNSSNYWLNAIVLNNLEERNEYLHFLNHHNIQARALWRPIPWLDPYKSCFRDHLTNTQWAYEHIINIPSSVRNNPI